MKVISVLNRKGGTGKTTFAVNISRIFSAEPEYHSPKILFIDLDAQGNGSGTLGCTYKNSVGSYEVITNKISIAEAIIHSPYPNIDVLQGTLLLDDAPDELFATETKEYILQRQLETVSDIYDYVIIDCQPVKNILTVNALTASDYVVVPMEATKYASDGVNYMLSFINEVKELYNPNIQIAGIIIIKKERSLVQDTYLNLIRSAFPVHVFNQTIRKSTVSEQAAGTNKPLYDFNKSALITQDFIQSAKELYFIINGGNEHE